MPGSALARNDVLPKSAFAGAIGYLLNLGEAVRTFLQDPRLRPDNGLSASALRPVAIGRKNWLFAGCKAGGDATGILLSLNNTLLMYCVAITSRNVRLMSKKEVATSDSTKTKRCCTLVPNWFWLFDTPAPWGGEDSFHGLGREGGITPKQARR